MIRYIFRQKPIVLFCLCLLGMLRAEADGILIDGFYYNLDKAAKTAELVSDQSYLYRTDFSYGDSNPTRYTTPHRLVIPSEVYYGGAAYQVTRIGENAFRYCGMRTLILPEGIVSIGRDAFYKCNGLDSIAIPISVKEIGRGAFDGTAWLDSLPDGLIYAGRVAYTYKGDVPEQIALTIKEGTVGIAEYAFLNRLNITSVSLPASLLNIGRGALSGTGLFSISVPSAVEYIGEDAFAYTPWYEQQPDGPIYLGSILYKYKSDYISNYDGSNCIALKVKDGTTCIAGGALSLAHQITSVVLPATLQTIGEEAFAYTDIKTLDLPTSVTVIGPRAFSNMSLTSLTFPASLTALPEGVCEGCKSLKSVVLPTYISTVPSRAFYGCFSGDVSNCITLPPTVYEIGSSAFEDCHLGQFSFPESLTFIGEKAFSGSHIWTSISISDDFYKDLVVPNSVTWICDEAFSSVELNHVTLPDHLTYIPRSCFSQCRSLLSIAIPATVTAIGSGAFEYCKSLESLSIPDAVTTIGGGTFAGCSSLADITFGKSLFQIGAGCFINTAWLDRQPEGIIYAGPVVCGYKGVIDSDDVTYRFHSGTKGVADCAFYRDPHNATFILPRSIQYLGYISLAASHVRAVYAQWDEPYELSDNPNEFPFGYEYGSNAIDTLYVPTGCYLKYYKSRWSSYTRNIVTTDIPDGIRPIINIRSEDSSRIYDLRGRRVEHPANGIYLRKGGKFIVR